MDNINILGIKIAVAKKKEILNKVKKYLEGDSPCFLTTPNAEIILEALRDKELFKILNKADLAVPDTITLKYASWVMGRNITRFPGADLVREILKISKNKKIVVINLAGGLSSAKEIKEAIKKINVDAEVLVEDVKDWKDYSLGQEMKEFDPEIIFVTLGGGKQEKIIYNKILNNSNLSNLKIAIGIGGAFDFITGKTKRAPSIMRKLGFEWLWRLIVRPNWSKKLGRIWRAVIVFPIRFAFWRFFIKK